MQWGKTQELPTDPRVLRRSSIQNIRSVLDALVELITNSDDSYRRLRTQGKRARGTSA